MRYYDISITNPNVIDPATKGNKVIVPTPLAALNSGSTYTNYVNGSIIAGGLDIEFQVRNYFYGNNQGADKTGSWVRIYGVSLAEVSQSNNLYGMNIVFKAGMQKGLPLAKPEQAGVICAGKIWQAIGNWEGIDKTLDLLIFSAPVQPQNFQFIWRKGTWLKDAIETTLATALPDYKVNTFISPNLIALKDKTATYSSQEAFFSAIKNLSLDPQFGGFKTLNGITYPGVSVTIRPQARLNVTQVGAPTPGTPQPAGSDILIIDMTVPYQDSRLPTSPLELAIEDFIGQPSWLEPQVITFKTVLRADIRVGDFVKLPQKPFGSLFIVVTPSSAIPNAPSRNQLAFQSSFFIKKVTHFGRLRQADASSWVTVFEGIFVEPTIPLPRAPQGTGLQGPT